MTSVEGKTGLERGETQEHRMNNVKLHTKDCVECGERRNRSREKKTGTMKEVEREERDRVGTRHEGMGLVSGRHKWQETAQDSAKMTPRRSRDDAKTNKMALPQNDSKMVLSCMRGANFAKSAMPSSVISPRNPKTAQSAHKRTKNELRWPQDGPKTDRQWPQERQKTTPRRIGEAPSRYQKPQNWRLV